MAADVTVFAILVPSALAYGELAGFEPVVGLYAALATMIAYALFGSYRYKSLFRGQILCGGWDSNPRTPS